MLPLPHLLLAGLVLTGAALAQAPVPPPPAGAPIPPGAPVPNAVLPLAQQVKQAGFLEPKITGERLAELYSELTGRRVTVSNAAIAAEFRFVQKGPITYGEAAELLMQAALLEGFVFVPSGDNHDKLLYAQSVAGPNDEPIPLISDAADLPEGEMVVTYVMALKHIKPEEVVRAFTSIVKQFGNFGSITAVPNAASVVITENSSLIRRLIELQQVIDVPRGDIGTRFIKVQYADVQELSETLNEILNSQQEQSSSAGVQRIQSNAPPGVVLPPGNLAAGAAAAAVAAGAADGGSAGEDVPIQIVPNPRTNEIFAMGRPVDIVFVESLIAGFDAPSDTRNYLRRKLKFLAVADFLPVAEQALQRAFSGNTEGGSAGGGAGGAGGGRATGANFGGGGGTGGGGSRTSGSSRGGSSSSGSSGSGSFGSGGTGGGGSGGLGGGGSSLGEPNVSSAPESLLVGRTLLVADNITNSIVIQGPPAGLEIITRLLDEIDVKAEQVMISCVFGQLALGDDLNYGIDYLRTVETRGDNAFGGRGGSGAGPILPLDGSELIPGNFPSEAGLGIYGQIGKYLNVYLEALQTSNRFNVISRPTVFMSNNQKGVIRSGQQIAVPTNTFNNGGVGGASQSTNIEYRDVVLNLEVIPLVNSADEVTLQISLISDEVIPDAGVTIDGNVVPTIATRELVTTVTVPNNETIVLGGLITSRDSNGRSGIPILSQIPYIGGLFGTVKNGKDREELLIFIQPKIIKDQASLYEGQVDMENRYKLENDNREFIDGPAVLPTKGAIQEPVTDGKSGSAFPAAAEDVGGPRRVSSRPKTGFVNRR